MAASEQLTQSFAAGGLSGEGSDDGSEEGSDEGSSGEEEVLPDKPVARYAPAAPHSSRPLATLSYSTHPSIPRSPHTPPLPHPCIAAPSIAQFIYE